MSGVVEVVGARGGARELGELGDEDVAGWRETEGGRVGSASEQQKSQKEKEGEDRRW
jgi:hypothetical protein